MSQCSKQIFSTQNHQLLMPYHRQRKSNAMDSLQYRFPGFTQKKTRVCLQLFAIVVCFIKTIALKVEVLSIRAIYMDFSSYIKV